MSGGPTTVNGAMADITTEKLNQQTSLGAHLADDVKFNGHPITPINGPGCYGRYNELVVVEVFMRWN